MVEFALVAPLFFLIVFAILQFSIFLYARGEMQALAFRASHDCAIRAGNANQACDRAAIRDFLNAHRPAILRHNRPSKTWQFLNSDITPIPGASNSDPSMIFQVRFDWNFFPSIVTYTLGKKKADNTPGWTVPIRVNIIVTPENI